MRPVADEQGVAARQFLGVNGRRVVGADQNGRLVAAATAQQSDVGIGEGRQQARVPLVQQVDGRYADEGAARRGLHGELRHQRLPGPGRQHHQPLPTRPLPGREGFVLMGVGRDVAGEAQLQLLKQRRFVAVLCAVPAQQLAHLAVQLPARPVELAAGVPDEQVGDRLRHLPHNQRASVIFQRQRYAASVTAAGERNWQHGTELRGLGRRGWTRRPLILLITLRFSPTRGEGNGQGTHKRRTVWMGLHSLPSRSRTAFGEFRPRPGRPVDEAKQQAFQ